MMRLLPVACATLALTACAIEKPAPLGPQPVGAKLGPALTSSQIRDELVGNTGTGSRTGTTSRWSMYVGTDGTLVSKSLQPSDSGTWRISDDGKFCMTWKVEFQGEETCQSVHKGGAAVQLASPKSLEELTFLPGKTF
jgi:hypothetical protein